jgi:hypothetical protein
LLFVWNLQRHWLLLSFSRGKHCCYHSRSSMQIESNRFSAEVNLVSFLFFWERRRQKPQPWYKNPVEVYMTFQISRYAHV